mmetsp:Transcript_47168/g.62460  ORF Transcript_47168/g.62460 Transcript_47168/m.62460 type:complete len:133 (+) Transcript_47168:410-808(+)
MSVKHPNLVPPKFVTPDILVEDITGRKQSSKSARAVSEASFVHKIPESSRFDPKKSIVAQLSDNLHNIYNAQDERAAQDNDSNFSAESFKRKQRKTSKIKRSPTKLGIDLKLTPLEQYEDEEVSKIMTEVNT